MQPNPRSFAFLTQHCSLSRLATVMETVVAAPSGPGVLGRHLHKNCLQEYTQRSGVPLPSYSTFNEGETHSPKFRAAVVVDGMKVTSPNTFSHRKEAEQDVAKLALECISVKFKNEGSLNIHKDPAFCKLILNEYGVKLKIDRPTYATTQRRGLLPMFITTITFDGKTYVGFAGRSKKEAEQYAAIVVIDSILANSNTGAVMAQIIKTKGRLYALANNGANVGNAALKSGNESDDTNDVKGTELVAFATNGLPMAVVDSQAIIPEKRKKKLKKRKQDQSKRARVGEQSIREQVFLKFLFLLMLPWSIHRKESQDLSVITSYVHKVAKGTKLQVAEYLGSPCM